MVQRLSAALIGSKTLFCEGLRRVLHPTHYQVKKVAETIDLVQKTADLDLIIFVTDTEETVVLDQVQRAKEEYPGARVVVMSDVDRPEMIPRLLRTGANGYLLRTVSPEALLASLDVVMLGGTVLPPITRNGSPIEGKESANSDRVVASKIPVLSADADHKRLSDRETDVLLCLMKGESNKIIARQFDIAEATVKVHLKAILRKIRVSNRTQAAVWAHNNRLALPTRLPKGEGVDPAGINGHLGPDAVWRGKTPLSS